MRTQRPRSDELQFVKRVLTATNPKDAYYINVEEQMRQYALVMLLGMILVLYMILV